MPLALVSSESERAHDLIRALDLCTSQPSSLRLPSQAQSPLIWNITPSEIEKQTVKMTEEYKIMQGERFHSALTAWDTSRDLDWDEPGEFPPAKTLDEVSLIIPSVPSGHPSSS
jgi:hypothetical protein